MDGGNRVAGDVSAAGLTSRMDKMTEEDENSANEPSDEGKKEFQEERDERIAAQMTIGRARTRTRAAEAWFHLHDAWRRRGQQL